jgi:uncharacterized membrane protein YkvA (DUF1232 family)
MSTRIPDHLKQRTSQLKRETYASCLAYRDPRTPWYTRILIACVIIYVFRPIELIPDFIPVIRYLDDLILVPLGLVLSIKMIPPTVLADCRQKANTMIAQENQRNRVATSIVILAWVLFVSFAVLFAARLMADWIGVVSWWITWFIGIS